jgi:hypothetical protein
LKPLTQKNKNIAGIDEIVKTNKFICQENKIGLNQIDTNVIITKLLN